MKQTNQKKKPGAKPAKKQTPPAKQTKGEAKRTARPTANPATPPPEVGGKVAPWRDWARRLCEGARLLWEKFEEANEAGASVELRCVMFYEAAHLAFRDFAEEVAEAGLKNLLDEIERERDGNGIAWDRLAVAVSQFPQTLRRLAESPAFATPTPPAPANAATPTEPATPAAKTKREKRPDWGREALSMAKEFEKALPDLLPKNRNPLNAKGQLDARRGGVRWKKIRECFDRWSAGAGMYHPGLRGFPTGKDAEEAALRSLFRALKDTTH
jgi:hypothetical protein